MSDLPYDSVWPGEEAVEKLWLNQGGIDFDGMGWMTPRMLRISDRIVKAWEEQDSSVGGANVPDRRPSEQPKTL